MNRFLRRLLITALSLGLTSKLVHGISIDSLLTLVLSSFVLNVVVTFIRPIITLLTLPFTLVTFGLFLLVVNGITLSITAWLMPGFTIDSLGSAVTGWIVLFLSGMVVSLFIDKKEYK